MALMAVVINLMVSGKVRVGEDISVALSSSKAEPNKIGANYYVTLIYGHHETSLVSERRRVMRLHIFRRILGRVADGVNLWSR